MVNKVEVTAKDEDKLRYLAQEIERLEPSSRTLFSLTQFVLERAVCRGAMVELKKATKQPITGEDECDYIFGNSAIALLTLLRNK